MTALPATDTRAAERGAGEVDIAGSRWPVYKLEAVAAGLTAFVLLLVLIGSAQAAVLLGATVATVLWTAGGIARRGDSGRVPGRTRY